MIHILKGGEGGRGWTRWLKKKGGMEKRTWGRSDEERERWYRKDKDTGRTHVQQLRTKKV